MASWKIFSLLCLSLITTSQCKASNNTEKSKIGQDTQFQVMLEEGTKRLSELVKEMGNLIQKDQSLLTAYTEKLNEASHIALKLASNLTEQYSRISKRPIFLEVGDIEKAVSFLVGANGARMVTWYRILQRDNKSLDVQLTTKVNNWENLTEVDQWELLFDASDGLVKGHAQAHVYKPFLRLSQYLPKHNISRADFIANMSRIQQDFNRYRAANKGDKRLRPVLTRPVEYIYPYINALGYAFEGSPELTVRLPFLPSHEMISAFDAIKYSYNRNASMAAETEGGAKPTVSPTT